LQQKVRYNETLHLHSGALWVASGERDFIEGMKQVVTVAAIQSRVLQDPGANLRRSFVSRSFTARSIFPSAEMRM
jgi:hypothetical protein